MPSYSTGESSPSAWSRLSTSSSIVRKSSLSRSLHSEMSLSRWCTSLHVSLCFSKNHAGVGRSQMRHRIGSRLMRSGERNVVGSLDDRHRSESKPYRDKAWLASMAASV